MAALLKRFTDIRSHPGARHNFFVLVVAFAFAVQSFFTQTHVHRIVLPFGGPGFVKADIDIGAPAGNKAPADSSPFDCPYCQAIAHSGLFFVPAAPLLRLPVELAQSMVAPYFIQVIKNAAILQQRSRAPPL